MSITIATGRKTKSTFILNMSRLGILFACYRLARAAQEAELFEMAA